MSRYQEKSRAVNTLLEHPEYTDYRVAEETDTTRKLVRVIRAELVETGAIPDVRERLNAKGEWKVVRR